MWLDIRKATVAGGYAVAALGKILPGACVRRVATSPVQGYDRQTQVSASSFRTRWHRSNHSERCCFPYEHP